MATEPFLLHHLRPVQKSVAPLTRAAASIALSQGQPQTIIDVLHGRAFRYYAEGLRQYLVIRTGTLEAGERHLAKLRAFVAKSDSESLIRAPGIRARLYRAARGYIHHSSRPPQALSSEQSEGLPWRALPSMHFSVSPLHALRFEMNDADSELLELRYARELGIDELAFVYDEESEVVQSRLDAAKAHAELLLSAQGVQDMSRFDRLVIEAFALQAKPRAASDENEGVEPLPGGTVIGGRYAIETRVGLGAFGDVYRAKDTEVPGHVVALKLLHQPAHSDQAKQSALRELRLIASVFHPSVVQFKDHGWFEERLWFVMPWYDGETLESRVQRQPLTRAEAFEIFQPLTRALAAMHAAGVRHQDVKPENIFLARIPGFGDEEVLPVLLDLGVASTEAEMVVAGTPTYFAPEVAAQFASVEDKPLVNDKADVFALALALRNSLEPETQEDVAAGAIDTFIEYRAREVPEPPQNKKLRYLTPNFERWLHKDADTRPTAEQFAEELGVLTRPEERRQRIKTVLQWAVPMVIALMGASGAAVTAFYQQAELERAEAERARMAEADVRQDLADTREAAEQLEKQYEQSRLTRAELAGRLARTDNEVASLTRSLNTEGKRLARTRQQLTETLDAKTAVEQNLSDTTNQLALTSKRLSSTENALRSEQDRFARTKRELELEEERAAMLRGRLAGLEARLEAEAAKAEALQSAVARAVAERSRVELELQLAEEEIAKLRAAQRRPAPMPGPNAEQANPADTI